MGFNRDFEAEVWLRFWSYVLVKVLKLKSGEIFEARVIVLQSFEQHETNSVHQHFRPDCYIADFQCDCLPFTPRGLSWQWQDVCCGKNSSQRPAYAAIGGKGRHAFGKKGYLVYLYNMIDMKTRNAFAEGAKEEVSGQLELCGTFPGGSFFERK